MAKKMQPEKEKLFLFFLVYLLGGHWSETEVHLLIADLPVFPVLPSKFGHPVFSV